MIKRLQQLSVRVKIMVALGLVIMLMLGGTFYWMAQRQEQQIIQQVHTRARALFENVVLTRAWSAAHGGVYIEKREGIETNPYLLQIPDLLVEFKGQNDKTYTLRNPALITRELSELGTQRNEQFAFRITSLKPLNPGNVPTGWEAQSLRRFEQGAAEASIIETEDGVETYRYMAPLIVTKACLKCHESQGYKQGDIRGGISVSVPMIEARAAIISTRQQLLLAGTGITAATLLILYVIISPLVIRPLQKIEETAREISQGHLEQQVPIYSRDEFGSLAHSFNQMTYQLRHSLENSEHQVLERTRRLEIAAHLSERFGAILDLDALLSEVVNRIKESFGYYYAHIYLFDKTGSNLVVAEGVGSAGATMKAAGHSIPLNAPKSLVARAARSAQVVSVDNVRESPDWLPNPLLPNTYSEMAVPIIYGQVIGVLDVQDDEIAGLDESDASLLRSLASQIAVALHNARLFAETEEALAETRAVQERYIEQTWQREKITHRSGKYRYVSPAAPALNEEVFVKAKQQALAQERPAIVTINGDDLAQNSASETGNAIVAPVTLGGKAIGALQVHRAALFAESDLDDQPWTGRDVALVEAVLEQVAQAAENLRLFSETRERVSREQAIREVTDKLRAAPDLDSLLEIAARELNQRLNVRHTVLELGVETEAPVNTGSFHEPAAHYSE